jgi:hypothetical protein
MTCGRGRRGFVEGAEDAGVMSVIWSVLTANQCRFFEAYAYVP